MKFQHWMVCVAWLINGVFTSAVRASDIDFNAEASRDMREANILFDKQDYREAQKKYESWLSGYSSHPLRSVVLFNYALSLEKQKKYREAVIAYRNIQETVKQGSPEFTDALYRQLICYEKLGDWSAGLLIVSVLDRFKLTGIRKIEFDVKKWFLEEQRFVQSKGPAPDLKRLQNSFEEFERVRLKEKTPTDAWIIFAHAAMKLADLEISKIASVVKTEADFKTQAEHILSIQHYLLTALAAGENEVRQRSVRVLAEVYEKWIQSGVNLSSPKELNQEESELYVRELKRKLLPLYERVVKLYEKERVFKDVTSDMQELNARVLRVQGVVNAWKRDIASVQ